MYLNDIQEVLFFDVTHVLFATYNPRNNILFDPLLTIFIDDLDDKLVDSEPDGIYFIIS